MFSAWWPLCLLGLISILQFTQSTAFVVPVPVPSSSSRQQQLQPLQMTSAETKTLRLVEGLKDIVDDYDVFVLDMWGVMHDGFTPYPGVVEAVKKLKAAGKSLIILSNSSQRQEKSIRNLDGLGFDPLLDFDKIITSGEVAYQLLSGELEIESWGVVQDILAKRKDGNTTPKVFVLGSGTEDESYCQAAGWELAPVEQADLIVARGTFSVCDGSTAVNKRKDEEAYVAAVAESLQKAAQRKIPM